MDDSHFLVECTSCGEVLRIAQRFKGKTGRCKKCGAAITAQPSRAASDTSPKSTAVATEPRGIRIRPTHALLGIVLFLVAVVAAAFYFMPHLSTSQLRTAAKAIDATRINKYVDLPSIDKNINDQYRAFIIDALSQYADQSIILSPSASSFVDDLVKQPVYAASSIHGLATIISEQSPSRAKYYESFNTFVVQFAENDQAKLKALIFSRHGLFAWRLSGIRLHLRRSSSDPLILQAVEGLAKKYYSGDGVQTDYVAASKLFQKAAGLGSINAKCVLAEMYQTGKGVPMDYVEAAQWYSKAAEEGDADAQYALSMMYAAGNGVPRDFTRSVELLVAAAEQGNTKAQSDLNIAVEPLTDAAELGFADAENALAILYLTGKGTPQDYAEAGDWFVKAALHGAEFVTGAEEVVRQAAENGNADAQYALGLFHKNGIGVPRDDAAAAEWYKKAAEKGNANAQYELGGLYRNGIGMTKDDALAVAWYAKAAEQGIADAQYEVANLYRDGVGVPKDAATAAAWYAKAAEQGIADAQYNLGRCYENGEGVRKNLDMAHAYYTLAAELGNVNAMTGLGSLYFVANEFVQASEWFLKAAEQGDPSAAGYLAQIFSIGSTLKLRNGKRDKETLMQAYMWFDIAATLHRNSGSYGSEMLSDMAVRSRDDAGEGLTPDEIEQAKQAANEWVEKTNTQKL